MKVIHFIASIDKSAGGTTAYMKLLAEELNNKIEIIVATGESINPVELVNIKTQFFNTKLFRWFFLEKEYYQFLHNEKPDLVHINGIWNPENSLFQKVAQKLGIKVIISPHGMLEPYILNRNPLKKKIALWLYQKNALLKAHSFHATATLEKNNIEKLGFKKEIIVIPNGISLNDFPNSFSEKSIPKKILFLSRIHPKKGIEFLIEAWSLLDTNYKNGWTVEIIGNGEESYIEELKEKIIKVKLTEEIKILQPVFGNQKINKFREASLFVLPTYSENFGIVIAESLASYTPVITTIGTPWEELNAYNCGWCIEIGSKPLKKTLEIALNKTDLELKEMGKNGRKLIELNYSIQEIGNKMYQLYKSINY